MIYFGKSVFKPFDSPVDCNVGFTSVTAQELLYVAARQPLALLSVG